MTATGTLFTDVLVWDADAPGGTTGPTDVLVRGQRIAAVGRVDRTEVDPGTRVVEGHGHHLLVPGLVNAHFHSPANHLKGSLPSLPLELFMLFESPVTPELRATPREAYLRTALGALEMLRGGTTCVQDDAFLMPSPEPDVIDAVLSAYRDCGIRARVALDQPTLPEADKLPYLADVLDAAQLALLREPAPASEQRLLESYDHLVRTWHGAADGRLRAAVSVSAPQRVSPEYFGSLDDLSRSHDLPLYAHMLETRAQRVLATEQPRFAGRSLVRWTADLGLLSERMNVIHAVWVDEDDIELLAASGAVVAHNPVSNLRLGSGVMPFRALRRAGVPVCLGVDEAICGDAVDMWGVVRTAGLVHTISGLPDEEWPSAHEVLDCLWRGGAQAVRQPDELGGVRPGMLADLALLDLHGLAFTPLNDVPGQLVYCASGQDVVLTMVDGAVVVDDGAVTTVDEAALLAEARELFAVKRPLVEAARQEAAAWLPAYRAMARRAAAAEVGMSRWVGR
ncbi:guanine deaminase/5-methylthioadenosine/S-adenosylhomocysteine deaminase [Motilibacter rhizosphaerae]|uniref:Guanine deaminase/5-methylthioadenosine/S-adenosylhomocysteine deaminase n=1 Tax=Motilibacter rhizosphaerae TaxID=598652 RepID=A0A4Q7NRK6_9ACTN|nr:amidohydrolase family protein [Motilibacter rhizosphaerae]RZS89706.1 guanine deaminase/5-methylthioadenosine/S-adenosylhomocysteine deaminase [Motilibacter rhizosphaerae]